MNANPNVKVAQSVVQLVVIAGTAPPTPPPPPPVGGGGKYRICRPPNCFDETLHWEGLKYRKIQFPPICSIPKEYRNLLPWDDTFGAIPKQAQPVRIAGGIVTPAPAAGDQVIVSGRIPPGFDGLLTGVFQMYQGLNFVQGSGDIVWRIQVDQHYVKDWGASMFALGSPQEPIPMTEGMIIFSGQTVRYIVNVPNLSGLIQVGQSTIVAGLLGFFWPR